MNVTCPNCATVYRVDPAKVPEAGVRARCAVCSAVFAVQREGQPSRTPEPAAVATGAAPSTSAPAAAAPAGATPRPEPVATPEPPKPDASTAEPVEATPSTRTAAPVAPPTTPPRPTVTPATPPLVQPPVVPPRPASPARPPATAAPPAPAAVPPAAAAPTPTAPAPPPAITPAAQRPESASPAGARPVNPFLSQDPALKARRLARALISDMVVYHPAKRQEGLRDGTLKELFEEEIKKSWEEYSDQVGRDLADSTSYFREALNEILAGGRQIF